MSGRVDMKREGMSQRLVRKILYIHKDERDEKIGTTSAKDIQEGRKEGKTP